MAALFWTTASRAWFVVRVGTAETQVAIKAAAAEDVNLMVKRRAKLLDSEGELKNVRLLVD